jgi:hypothetical protein
MNVMQAGRTPFEKGPLPEPHPGKLLINKIPSDFPIWTAAFWFSFTLKENKYSCHRPVACNWPK